MESGEGILLVDVGNSMVKTRVRAPSGALGPGEAVPSARADFPTLLRGVNKGAVIASVVPRLTKAFLEAATAAGVTVLELEPEVAVRAGIRGVYPSMGQDRIAAIVASASLYSLPCVCIDAGTAVTLDFVDETRVYRGGLIMPGPALWVKSLAEGTAVLPSKDPVWDDFSLATDTSTAVAKGVAWGSVAMLDGLLRLVRMHVGEWSTLVLTGGWACRVSSRLTWDHTVDEDIVFKGMGIAWDATYTRGNAR